MSLNPHLWDSAFSGGGRTCSLRAELTSPFSSKSVSVSKNELKPHLFADFFFKPLKMFIFIQLHVTPLLCREDASPGGFAATLRSVCIPLGNGKKRL